MFTSTKIRIYPTAKQEESLAKAFGCARWYWNNSLEEMKTVHQETGKWLGQFALNKRLLGLKKENEWLAETHSQVLQSVSLNMSRAFVNFFERRAKYPNFKSKHGKQSIQYPQDVKIVDGCKIFLPKIGHFKAVVHREIVGVIKTVILAAHPLKTGEHKQWAEAMRLVGAKRSKGALVDLVNWLLEAGRPRIRGTGAVCIACDRTAEQMIECTDGMCIRLQEGRGNQCK